MNEATYVTRPLMPSIEEYCEEIRSIWDVRWLTNMGAKHQQLESELEKYMEVPRVGLVVNGHMALEIALQALNIKGEVITTPFTFVSTTHAISRSGAKPVFCDICEDDYTIDTSMIERLISDKTEAIMPVHVYGNVCKVDEIEKIAKEHGLKVIYDAAHAFGVKYKGKDVAGYGDASCYSFHATKVFNTIEGGAICTNNTELYESVLRIRDFGIKSDDDVTDIGTNAKMNEFSAAMGICNLRHFQDAIMHRKEIYTLYCEKLSLIPGIRINKIQDNVESNYAYYPIVIDPILYGHNREELMEYLKGKNIYTRKYFYPIISKMPCYSACYSCENTPIAEKISESVLTLPIYDSLDLDTADYICALISEYKD